MKKRKLRLCLRMQGGEGWVGGAYYVQNLIRCLAELPSPVRGELDLTLEYNSGSREFVECVEPLVDHLHVNTRLHHLVRGAGRVLLQRASRGALGRLPRPYDMVYPASATGRGLCFGAGWIADFQHRYLPHLFSIEEVAARERRFLAIALNLDLVVLSSEMAANDFRRLYPFSAHKARVLRFTSVIDEQWLSQSPLQTLQNRNLPKIFFLVSNQFWVHKNHEVVIDAAAECKRRGQPVDIVFTGSHFDAREPNYVERLKHKIAELGIGHHMHLLGQIPRQEQIQLFRACRAVIQPSKFEGWSTVIEDARALGKPVVMSDFPVHLEQSPPGARVFPLDDSAALASTLLELLQVEPSGFNEHAERAAVRESQGRRLAVANQILGFARENPRD